MTASAEGIEAALIETGLLAGARARGRAGRRARRGVRPPVLPLGRRPRTSPSRERARPLRRRARALELRSRTRAPGAAKVRVYNPEFEQHGWQSTHTAVEIVTDDMPFLVDSVDAWS